MIKTVHVVFKTHLDIGFTDLASRTVERYFNTFIPQAIATADELRRRGGEERLSWTTGSWLINSYLQHADDQKRRGLEEAVKRGDITWHALPFTTHTELMNTALVEYALSISHRLDAQFGRKTIAAKMTDVPGHTLALVPHLAKAGVHFLHLGVNGGSALPDVPPLFVWRAPTGEEIVVQYDASYGSSEPIEPLEDLLVIENSADNSGPPSVQEVLDVYANLRKKFPEAKILASNLSAYAEAVLERKSFLPVLDQEIGDTWIHGVGSDPYKVSCLKRLFRWAETRQAVLANDTFMENLMLVCEHTWGMDFKKYLGDYLNYSIEAFRKAKERDVVTDDAVPEAFRSIEEFARREYEHIFGKSGVSGRKRSYSLFSSSHMEQRAYITKAVDSLPHALKQEALAVIATVEADRQLGCESLTVLDWKKPVHIGGSTVHFSQDGSIVSLIDASGRELAKGDGIGAYRYEAFSDEDYLRFHHEYNRNFDTGRDWILADYGKPGMPSTVYRLCKGTLIGLYRKESGDSIELQAHLEAEEGTPLGAPKTVRIIYRFSCEGKLKAIKLVWNNKEENRLPEAMWLGVGLNLEGGEWKMVKLGKELPMDRTVYNGARSIHAVESLIWKKGEESLRIDNIDSPLVSIEKRKLLRFNNELPVVDGVFNFNLHNNIWDTNFPLWYGEDGSSTLLFS